MSILKILIDARAKITNARNWTIGLRKMPIDNGDHAYCALGAIEAAIGVTRSPLDFWHEEYVDTCRVLAGNIENEVDANIRKCMKKFYGLDHMLTYENLIADYNNKHTHKEVLAWFDRTIANQQPKDIIAIEPARELEYA